MGIKKRMLMKAIETMAYRNALKELNNMTMEQISVDYVMADFQKGLDSNTRGNLDQIGFTEDDIKEIVKNIVPKLRKEKERRLSK